MVYAYRFEGWVKVGWVQDNPLQRAIDGFWENSHTHTHTELCYKLDAPHCQLIGLWEARMRVMKSAFMSNSAKGF